MPGLWLEFAVIAALVGLNGLLALSELAVVSSRKPRLERMARRGVRGARAALALASAPDDFLSTVQVGITFVGILAGAFGGATLAEFIAGAVAPWPPLAAHGETIGVAVVVLGITYLSLVIGELVPKRLALAHPERFACLAAPPLRTLARLAHPLVGFLSGSSRLVLRLLRVRPSQEPAVTEEEIKIMLEQGARAGIFQEFERETIHRIFRLADRRVAVLMTPRSEIVWLGLDDGPEAVRHKIADLPHSFYPVAKESLDRVAGVVWVKDLLLPALEGKPPALGAVCRPPLYVAETTPAVRVLETFQGTGTHFALVVDEYGALQGLVTYEDILRSAFEDVEDAPRDRREIVERRDGTLLVAGALPLDEFFEHLETDPPDGEERRGVNTVGGFVMVLTGVVPSAGQSAEWRGWKFEVADMDGNRVDKVRVTRPARSDGKRG